MNEIPISVLDQEVGKLFEAAKIIEDPWQRIAAIRRAAQLLEIYPAGYPFMGELPARLLGITEPKVDLNS